MGRLIKIFSLCLVMIGLMLPVQNLKAEPFVVQDIRVEGLQRISAGTVFNYMPVKIGQQIDSQSTGSIIRALYKTGFFKDVVLEREGAVLIVSVREWPAIAKIDISGNESIESEQLLESLKDIGLAEGRVFNRSVLDKIEQELKRQYFSSGRYGATIKSTVSPLERNRVAVSIEISEGATARIKKINIIGNDSYEEDDLLDQFTSSTTGFLSFFTKDDQYSKQQLSGDLELLRSYYLDRGHINFKIDSTQVSITPDKKDIYITVNLNEGDIYTISDIKLAGDFVVPKEQIFPLIHLARGGVFSRKSVVGSSDRITGLLSDEGYAFANVNSIPDIDDENRQVSITYFVDPGKRVYVRRVNMKGNSATRDEVLRRELRQMEAAWFSTAKVRKSRERLQRLGYFDEINVETPAVPGSTDQVDVNITVVEKAMGNLAAGVGFSQSDGVIFNASISQDNFLGSGKFVAFALNTSSVAEHYQLSYRNPYYTIDGISRGFNIEYQSRDFGESDSADYLTDRGTLGLNFGVPIKDEERVRFDFDLQHTDFKVGDTPSDEVLQWETDNGSEYLDLRTSIGWGRDSRDHSLMPTRGGTIGLTGLATIPGSDLTYYKITYKQKHYFPLNKVFTFALKGDVGYGESYGDTTELPLWEHFFAGGIKTVRGYKDFSLGPRDSEDKALGGNFRMLGSAELFFPPPIESIQKTVRLGLFVDGGNAWDTNSDDIAFEDLRFSTGISGFWLSPFGALGASFAKPLNAKDGDDTESFQFLFGSAF
ncbi:MAG: outer membrane protein assembly factor BamA [Gammaproteobacteria bacterium]|nr:outer membrane protein assembly factor BamA [Gammaproteobacteria bacterium]